MLLLKQDSKLNNDDKNVAVFTLLTQPQNPSLYSIPVNSNKFIRATTQNKLSPSLIQVFSPQEICHLKSNNKVCMSVKTEHFRAKPCDTTD